MTVKSKIGLEYRDHIGLDEEYYPDMPIIFDPTPKDENYQTPVKFIKEGGMNVFPPHITGKFMPSPNHSDFDESHMTYGKKSNDLPNTNSETNDFVSCSFSNKSLETKTNVFASCDSSDKYFSPKPDDFSTRVADDEPKPKTVTLEEKFFHSVKNNFVSFSVFDNCLCNKQGCVKNKSFKNKSCFVCGSKFHLIKDCDYYEKMGAYNDQLMLVQFWFLLVWFLLLAEYSFCWSLYFCR